MASSAYDCQSCGACCCNPDENRAEGFAYYVEVTPKDGISKRPELAKKYVVYDDEGVPHMRLDPSQRCSALRGKLGQRVHCAIYADRPRGCRLVEAGSDRCRQYRRERGVSPW